MQDNKRYALDWLLRRGLTKQTIKQFGLRWGNHPTIGQSIVIPVHDVDGNFLFNKYRRDPLSEAKPKYVYDRGGKITLYGAQFIKPDQTRVLITEGELDALVAWSQNIPAVSSTGGANSFQPDWAEILANKEIIVCYDADAAGAAGMVRTLKIVPSAKILFLPPFPGVKDISDYVGRGGNLPELLRTAKHYDGVEAVREDRAARASIWLPTLFHDAYLAEHARVKYHNERGSFRTDVKADYEPDFLLIPNALHKTGMEVAKSVLRSIEKNNWRPISDFIKFDSRHKARCIWHNEKTASLHYYEKNNSVYCFGCGKYGDTIDVIRQKEGCSFAEAAKKAKL